MTSCASSDDAEKRESGPTVGSFTPGLVNLPDAGDAVEGGTLTIDFDSVCIHSDTPGALELVKATRDVLSRNNIAVAPPRSLRAS